MSLVNFGLIGVGGRGMAYVNVLNSFYKDEGKFIALSDIDEKRLKEKAKKSGGTPKLFTDYKKMLSLKELDVVVISTPDFTHETIAIDCLNAGKHIICEKPLAITVESCNKIIEASRKAKKMVQLGLVLRYTPFHRKLKDIIDSGKIGNVKVISMLDYYSGGMTYFRRWNRFKKNTGGLLIHKGCHAFDILNWLADSSPKRVTAFGGLDVFRAAPNKPKWCRDCKEKDTCPGSSSVRQSTKNVKDLDLCLWNSEKDTNDNDTVIIEYENGVHVNYTECLFPVRTIRYYSIIGDRGEIEADSSSNQIKVHSLYSKDVVTCNIKEERGHGGGDVRLFEDFFTFLKEGREPLANAEAGKMSALIGIAAEKSISEGRIINIKELT